MANNRNYKCPFCNKKMTRDKLSRHIDNVHNDMIPQGYTALRYTFDYINKKPSGYNGICTECGGETGWDENKGRYNRQCGKKQCHDSYVKKFEKNMMRTKGVTRISSTPEGQIKMLNNRKISGKYKFHDGGIHTYTGTYEMKCLKFMDKVMNCKSSDIMSPGPVLKYKFNDAELYYISDIYYIPYNLIIEIKDGGDNPNKRNMAEYRSKQIAKEKHIVNNTNYNYIRLTDNNFGQLLSVFMDLKLQLNDNSGDRVIHINEFMTAMSYGTLPGFSDTGSTYIVNYLRHNTFSDNDERGYGITNDYKLNNLIIRDKDGKLSKADNEFVDSLDRYDIYKLPYTENEISAKFERYMGKHISEGFIYETLFGKKLYDFYQIELENSIDKLISMESSCKILKEMTVDYLSNINSYSESTALYDSVFKNKSKDYKKIKSLLEWEINNG